MAKKAQPPSGPSAAPPKDPQPSVDRIDDLARRVLIGDILLPKFQRDLVWKRQQILDLLDSVGLNYPIGSLLLWQSRQELRSENCIADLEIQLPKPDYPVNYLLDGQQRLSTICGALHWNGDDPNSVWNIAYDLRHRQFVHLDSLDDPPQHFVRMNKLADGAGFYKYCATLDSLSAPDKDTLKENADLLFNRFKDYKVATVTLGDMSIQDVAPIFERINSTGTRLTIVDLMRAATWSQDFDLIDSIDDVLAVLESKDFGGIDRKVVLRVMSAAAGGGFSVESIDALRNYDSDVLKAAMDASQAAFEKAVDFLVTQIRIPSDSIVPYANQVVVLAELFRQCPKPSAAQYSAITKWFWRSAISGYFSGWNTGNMSRDKQAVVDFLAGKTSEMEVTAYKPNHMIWQQKVFRADNAHAKTLAIILAHNAPVDLLTGQHIDVSKSLSWTNAKEYHHFFPRDYLKTVGVSANLSNCLANIVMLTSVSNKRITNRPPSDYLKDVQRAGSTNLDRWLASNLISDAAFKAAMADDYQTFIEERSQTIDERVSQLTDW
ncbi:GmrSD restriction endonuclease domain-containing protein [Bremerella sp. T1]|uniref:GmrSD restriction endonuclease domain-containing protein n=1 Tax=Bremerella sp. TYQ1 TaxID=3119568 RepID=UPI001CC9270D|nr:DUF262 domain-containing protein [Bremerella volcania]UBM36961.1 DUF262 domain-containing protein [Bremerella volcania]